MTFEQIRAMYGSDEQMARALFEQVEIIRMELVLQQQLRQRAENRLQACLARTRQITDRGIDE